jgi:hypothetical protein
VGLVFFVPALLLLLREPFQSIAPIVAAFPAAYVVFLWVFLFASSVQYGGVITIVSSLALLVLSGIRCRAAWRKRKKAQPVCPTAPLSLKRPLS